MENIPASPDHKSVCERIFKAVTVSPVRTIRRISDHPLDTMPTTAAPDSTPTLYPSVNDLHAQSKTAAEAVPIDFGRSISIGFNDAGFQTSYDKKEKSEMPPQVLIQNHIQAVKSDVQIQPAVKETKMIKSTKTVDGQRHDEAVAPPHVWVVDKPKPNAAIVQQEKAVVGSSHGQLDKFASNMEPKQPHVEVQKRPNSKEAWPKVTRDSPANIEKNHLLHRHNTNDKFSEYINRAKLKIRATSDVGTGKNTPRVDSVNEKVNDFIDRAKLKFRTTSSIGGGKSVSFK